MKVKKGRVGVKTQVTAHVPAYTKVRTGKPNASRTKASPNKASGDERRLAWQNVKVCQRVKMEPYERRDKVILAKAKYKQGVEDGKAGVARTSDDEHYLSGYAYGEFVKDR